MKVVEPVDRILWLDNYPNYPNNSNKDRLENAIGQFPLGVDSAWEVEQVASQPYKYRIRILDTSLDESTVPLGARIRWEVLVIAGYQGIKVEYKFESGGIPVVVKVSVVSREYYTVAPTYDESEVYADGTN